MRVLNDAIEEVAQHSIRECFGDFIIGKLKEQGVHLSRAEVSQIRKWTIGIGLDSVSDDIFPLRNRNVSFKFTDDDREELEEKYADIAEKCKKALDNVIEKSAINIFTTLKRRWPKRLYRLKKEQKGFEYRLNRRWGAAIGKLEMLLEMSREFGAAINDELRRNPASQPCKIDVLTRLHARSCQVVTEIIALLKAGLADGAMARWRTLHEIATIALFISKHDEELAKRYSLHQVVESRRAANNYIECQDRLGYEPMDQGEIDEIESTYENLIGRYGLPFGTDYGWASAQLKNKKPSFADIEKAVGIDHLRAHYRMASHNVHANPKGVFFKMGLLRGENLLLPGASNIGLADPGQCAAISFLQISTALGMLHPTVDNVVVMKIMYHLEEECIEAFIDVHQQFMRDSD